MYIDCAVGPETEGCSRSLRLPLVTGGSELHSWHVWCHVHFPLAPAWDHQQLSARLGEACGCCSHVWQYPSPWSLEMPLVWGHALAPGRTHFACRRSRVCRTSSLRWSAQSRHLQHSWYIILVPLLRIGMVYASAHTLLPCCPVHQLMDLLYGASQVLLYGTCAGAAYGVATVVATSAGIEDERRRREAGFLQHPHGD